MARLTVRGIDPEIVRRLKLRAAERGRSAEAEHILLAECGSALWVKARRGEIGQDEAMSALGALRRAPVVLTPVPVLVTDALRLALLIGHPIYDCLYLALSLQTRSAMVTADRRFAAALARHDELAPFVIFLDELV